MNLSLFLFLIGILGFILNRKNLLLLIISIEIMLLAVTLLIVISSFTFDDNIGQTFAIYVIAIAGAESVIGLSILVAYYRSIFPLIKILKNKLYRTFNYYWARSTFTQDNFKNNVWPITLVEYTDLLIFSPYTNHRKINNLYKIRLFSTWSGMSKKEREAKYIYPKSRTITVSSNTLQKIESNFICSSIVKYGQYSGSVLGFRLSQHTLNSIFLSHEQKEILVGILLGDGYIQKKSQNGNALIQFNQGYLHLQYILHVSYKLSSLCTHFPLLILSRDGSFSLKLSTRCLLCLNPMYDLFIKNKKKTISPELINWLSPRSLAYWAMDDGSLSESGFYFNTMSYTLEEHILLQKILKYNFNLETSIHKHKNKYKLYIKAKSMPIF